jgi:hypothetical protein
MITAMTTDWMNASQWHVLDIGTILTYYKDIEKTICPHRKDNMPIFKYLGYNQYITWCEWYR